MVIENQANLTIGYISTNVVRNSYMKPSYIYYTSNLVWIVPPGRFLSSFEKLFKPFRKVMWICILVVFVLSFIAIRIVLFQPIPVQNFVLGPQNSSPCLNIINIFVGGSLHKLPGRNFARFLLAFFMIYCLVIRSSYQGRFLLL